MPFELQEGRSHFHFLQNNDTVKSDSLKEKRRNRLTWHVRELWIIIILISCFGPCVAFSCSWHSCGLTPEEANNWWCHSATHKPISHKNIFFFTSKFCMRAKPHRLVSLRRSEETSEPFTICSYERFPIVLPRWSSCIGFPRRSGDNRKRCRIGIVTAGDDYARWRVQACAHSVTHMHASSSVYNTIETVDTVEFRLLKTTKNLFFQSALPESVTFVSKRWPGRWWRRCARCEDSNSHITILFWITYKSG